MMRWVEVRAAVADAKPPPRGDPNGGNRFDIPRKGQSAAPLFWHTPATNRAPAATSLASQLAHRRDVPGRCTELGVGVDAAMTLMALAFACRLVGVDRQAPP
jgi:hypothetical protein